MNPADKLSALIAAGQRSRLKFIEQPYPEFDDGVTVISKNTVTAKTATRLRKWF